MNLAQAKYVTRLSYKGDLKDLYNDAEFKTEKPITYEEHYNFLQRIFSWISNLFS